MGAMAVNDIELDDGQVESRVLDLESSELCRLVTAKVCLWRDVGISRKAVVLQSVTTVVNFPHR